MPLPLIPLLLAGGAAIWGGVKTVQGVSKFNEAKDINEEANYIQDSAKSSMNYARNKANTDLEKYGKLKADVLANSYSKFISLRERIYNDDNSVYGRCSKDCLNSRRPNLNQFKEMSDFATSIFSGVASGAGAGALTAFGAFSAVGSLAAASTGTAISSLAGAAATNATLAWLGGGALAAGGAGVAGGMAVLGGLVVAPLLLVGGFVINSKAEKALDDAKANRAKAKTNAVAMDAVAEKCTDISRRVNLFHDLLEDLNRKFIVGINELEKTIKTYGTNFLDFPESNQISMCAVDALSDSIAQICNTNILDSDGNVTDDSYTVYNRIKQAYV